MPSSPSLQEATFLRPVSETSCCLQGGWSAKPALALMSLTQAVFCISFQGVCSAMTWPMQQEPGTLRVEALVAAELPSLCHSLTLNTTEDTQASGSVLTPQVTLGSSRPSLSLRFTMESEACSLHTVDAPPARRGQRSGYAIRGLVTQPTFVVSSFPGSVGWLLLEEAGTGRRDSACCRSWCCCAVFILS